MVQGDIAQKRTMYKGAPSPSTLVPDFLSILLSRLKSGYVSVAVIVRGCEYKMTHVFVYYSTCRWSCSGGQGGEDGGSSPRGWGWERSHDAPSASGVSTKPPTHTLPPRFVFQVQANGQNAMVRLPPVYCGL